MIADYKPDWLFFGCIERGGHFLVDRSLLRALPMYSDLAHLDGQLAPKTHQRPYEAVMSRLGGWGLTALSFWDYSIDTRPGSNAIVFAPSLIISGEALLGSAEKVFPRIWKRFPAISIECLPR